MPSLCSLCVRERATAEALDESITQAGRECIQPHKPPRFCVWVNFRCRPIDGISDGIRHRAHRLSGSEGALYDAAGLA